VVLVVGGRGGRVVNPNILSLFLSFYSFDVGKEILIFFFSILFTYTWCGTWWTIHGLVKGEAARNGECG
jgi:hypothetical protein